MTVGLSDILTSQVVIPFAAGFLAVLIVAAVLLLIRGSYRKSVSKALSGALQEKEAAKALLSGIVEMQYRLSDEGDAIRRVEFIDNDNSTDRAAIGDLRSRAVLIVDELDVMPAPKRLIPLIEKVADIAFLAEEALGRVEAAPTGEKAYETLMAIDINHLMLTLEVAERDLNELAVYYGLTEVAVYKGGLYV